LKERKW
jgi:hypothetical protein